MERGSAAPPPFLTTPTLDIILYPPCDPPPPPSSSSSSSRPTPLRRAARDLSRGFLSIRASGEDTPATFMWDAHRHAERYNAHVSRRALLRASFRPAGGCSLFPKGILADSFQFRNRLLLPDILPPECDYIIIPD